MWRRSIIDMIQVTKRTTRNEIESAENKRVADISETVFAVFGAAGWSLWPMAAAQKIMAAQRAMKMSRLQPARRPSLPMKILWRAEGCAGGMGSVGVNVASPFKGPSSCGESLSGISIFSLQQSQTIYPRKGRAHYLFFGCTSASEFLFLKSQICHLQSRSAPPQRLLSCLSLVTVLFPLPFPVLRVDIAVEFILSL